MSSSKATRTGLAGTGRFRAAYTLLELCLVMGLIVAIGAIAVVAAGYLRGREAFDEGVERFEAMLRMASADAAIESRRVRIAWAPAEGLDGYVPEVLWESDPTEAPGEFTSYRSAGWLDLVPRDGVRVLQAARTGDSAYAVLLTRRMSEAFEEDALADPVTFHPDGSSDSAVFDLAATDESDPRRAIVEIDGLTGAIRTYRPHWDEVRDYMQTALDGGALRELHAERTPIESEWE